MVKLRFDTDLSNSIKVTADLSKAVDLLGDKYESSANEARKLEKAAERIVASNLSPQEKYNRKVEEYAKLVKAGKLSVDDAEKSLGRHAARLEQSFGASALAKVGSYAAGVASLSAAAAALADNFRRVAQDADAASQRISSGLGASGELAQVATSPSDLASLKAQSAALRARGIASDRSVADQITFQLRSSGLSSAEAEPILSLAERGFIGPEGVLPVATGARKFQRAFGLKSIEGVLDAAAQASQGTSANLSQTMTAALDFAAAARDQGVGFDEGLAALVVAEQQSKDVTIAGTQVKSLLEAAKKKGLRSTSIFGLVGEISAREAKGESTFDILGRSEAVTAYSALKSNRGGFDEQVRLLQSADARNVASVAADLNLSDPELQAGLLSRRSQGRRELTDEALYGRSLLVTKALRNAIDERQRRRGGFVERAFGGAMRGIGERFEDFFGLQGASLRTTTASDLSGLPADVQQAVRDYQKDSLELQRKQLQALEGMRLQPAKPSGRQE